MAKFCIYCGKPIDEKTKFCPFCGKAIAATQPASAPTPADMPPKEPTPAQTPTPQPAAAPAVTVGNHTNWLLIGSIAVIVAVLMLVVVLALQDKKTDEQPQYIPTQDTPAQDTQDDWPDIPGFSQDDV